MDKRQDAQKIRATPAAWLTTILFFVLLGSACQSGINPAPINLNPPMDTPTTNTPADRAGTPGTPTPHEPITTPTLDCLQGGGTLESDSFFSEFLGEDFHYRTYLPPCYDIKPDQHYPVVYLLHGLSYNHDQWIRLGMADHMDRLIASGAISPFIIILPGEARFLPPQSSPFADALVQELIPWVDQHYRTHPDQPHRSIGGLSRGAAWSVRIGFENHQLFSSIGAHSLPLFEIDGNRLSTWLAQIPNGDVPVFFIDIGRGDPERLTAQNFADQLNDNNIPHTWYLFNGSHTEEYWSGHLEDYLRWYARDW